MIGEDWLLLGDKVLFVLVKKELLHNTDLISFKIYYTISNRISLNTRGNIVTDVQFYNS